MTDNDVPPHSGERESGVSGFEARERYSLERMFDRRFSRPEPTGGTWYQIGPFGMAGYGRPRPNVGPGKGNWRRRQEVQDD